MGNFGLLVRATLALYRDAARDGARALGRHPWLIALVPLYSIALAFAQSLAAGLGFLGGIVVMLALAGCVSSFLAILAGAVARERVVPSEISAGFGRYLWSIVNVLFLFWIIQLLLTLITQQNPGLLWVALAVDVGIFIVCNPLPELIYQGSRDGFGLIDDAVQFTRDNAVEWLLPVAVLLLPLFLLDARAGAIAMAELGPTSALRVFTQVLSSLLPASLGGLGQILLPLIASAVLVWVMLFRGFLFRALNRGGRRQRMFEARMRGN